MATGVVNPYIPPRDNAVLADLAKRMSGAMRSERIASKEVCDSSEGPLDDKGLVLKKTKLKRPRIMVRRQHLYHDSWVSEYWITNCTVCLAGWLTLWWLTDKLTDWQTDRKTDRLVTDWLTDWLIILIVLIDWLIDWLDEWLNEWVTDWLTAGLLDWLTDWLTAWLLDWLLDWLFDWLIDWLVDWLVDWLNDWLSGWLAGWLADWLTDWLIDWLIDWLSGWLTCRRVSRWVAHSFVYCQTNELVGWLRKTEPLIVLHHKITSSLAFIPELSTQ